MSQRVDAYKFISNLQKPEVNARLNIILTDNTLIRRLIAERLKRIYSTQPVLYSGKSPLPEAIEALSSGSLFGEPAPVWIELPEKISAKQWTEVSQHLQQLSEPARQELYILAPALARHGVPDAKTLPWKAQVLVIYEPSRADAMNILAMIAPRHGDVFSQASKSNLLTWCQNSFDYYSDDLEACDLHFQRMAQGHLAFDAAFVPKTTLDAFDFIEAFSTGEPSLIQLRMNQLEQAGEDASRVLAAFAYTGRQVLAFQAALEKTGHARSAHELVKTPYPSQGRIERLAKRMSPAKWAHFFLSASDLEQICRSQRNPHHLLAVELTSLLN